MALTAAIVVPPAYGIGALTAANVEGTSAVAITLVTLLVAVSATLLVGLSPSPSVPQLLTRGVGLALLAIAFGAFSPSLSASWSAATDGLSGILSTPFGRLWLLFTAAHMTGHGVGARVALFVEGPATRSADRLGEEAMVALLLTSATVNAVVIGLTAPHVGLPGMVMAAGATLLAVLTLAHLRASTPHPGGRRAPLRVATSRRRWQGMVAGTLLLVVALTAVGVTALPAAVTEASPRFVAWFLDAGFDIEPPPRWGTQPEGERVTEGGAVGGPLDEGVTPRSRVPDEAAPPWILMTVGVLALSVLLVLLGLLVRRERWREILRTLWRWLRAGGPARAVADGGYEPVGPGRSGPSQGPRSGRLERFRPRPRDPRGAILYDYLRAERSLARHDLPRARWETLLEYADRLGLGSHLRELAELASHARYGREEPPSTSAERSRELARHVTRVARDREPAVTAPEG